MINVLNTLFRKLSSRKLWMAVAAVSGGLSLAMGNDATEMQSIMGVVATMIGSVAYIITEGKVDAANAGTIINGAEQVKDAIEKVEG